MSCSTPSGLRNEAEQLLAEHRRQMAEAEASASGPDRRSPKSGPNHRRGDRPEGTDRGRGRAETHPARNRDRPRPALSEIWTKTADLAVSVAGKVLAKDLSGDDHRRLVSTAMSELPVLSNGNGQGSQLCMTAADTDAPPTAQGTVLEDVPQVTRSYSEALVNAAEKTGQVDEILDDLDAIFNEALGPGTDFAAVLASPLVSPADKDRTLVAVFEGRVQPTVLNFLRVLNRHGRLGSLAAIARAARALWDKRQNRRPVLVRTAVPLDEAQQDALRDHLGRMLARDPVGQARGRPVPDRWDGGSA